MTKFFLMIVTSLFIVLNIYAEEAKKPHKVHWEFDGIFGNFDRRAAQRGLQVYREVCSACHSLNRISFRNLVDLGFSQEEIKNIAAAYTVTDGPNDQGEMFERSGKASDHFTPPYPNEEASRAANNGRFPPDHSLIVKAREDGANYLYSLLTGYHEPPEEMHIDEGLHYNPYFPGGKIGMAPPLSDDAITYQDGTRATVEQMSHDIVTFLQWAAEPEMEKRKKMGMKVIIYLTILTILFYLSKKIIWRSIKK